jgi:hypothetical protein
MARVNGKPKAVNQIYLDREISGKILIEQES